MDYVIRKRFFDELEKEIQELVNPETGLLSDEFSDVINCPLCNAVPDEQEQLFVKQGYTFVRCVQCGMIFSNPQVKEEHLNQVYGKSKAEDIWVELQKSEKEKSWKKDYYMDCIESFSEHINKEKEDVKLLDVGCSTGYFLEVVKGHKPDWQANGLELSAKASEHAISKGLNVERKLLKDISCDEKYDIVTSFGVLEHLTSPENFLNDVKRHAGEQGMLVMVIVPNSYSLYHMLLQEKSLSFDGRDHLLYFSTKTLRQLFEMNNFEVLKVDTVLTGLTAIKRQIQWYNPNSEIDTDKFIPDEIKPCFEDGRIDDFIYKKNLGLRLRLLARYDGGR